MSVVRGSLFVVGCSFLFDVVSFSMFVVCLLLLFVNRCLSVVVRFHVCVCCFTLWRFF